MSGSWERQNQYVDLVICHTISGWETVSYEWHERTAQLQIPEGMKYTRIRMPEPVVDVSRDKAVQLAIQQGAKWLFFLDTDLIVPPDTLRRLIAHDKPIIGGLYVRRHNPPFNEMLKFRTDGLPGLAPMRDGDYQMGSLVECDAIATGMMLLKLEVFEKIKPFQIAIDGIAARPAWFLWTEWRLPSGGMCVLPDQSVFGGSPIQEIEIGEKIYNGYGSPVKVVNTFEKQYTGEIVKIVRRGLRIPIRTTPEHQILVLQNVLRCSKFSGQQPRYRGRFWNLEHAKETWLPASELKKGDWVGFPLFHSNEASNQILNLREYQHDQSKLPEEIPLNSELAYFMGLYFAEGSAVESRIELSFNMVTEIELAENTAKLARKIFGLNARTMIGDHAINVLMFCRPLSRALKEWFGKDARTKVIPKWIIDSSKEIWKSFLLGVFHGDGFVTYSGFAKHKTIGFNLATKDGALGIFGLLASLGIRPTIRKYIQPEAAFGHGNPIYHVKVLTDFDKLALMLGEEATNTRVNSQECSFFFHDHLWLKISSVEREQYDGPVYDLTVSEKNSYILEGMTVHNSEDFSFCARARASGIPIYCDTSIHGLHAGPMKFRPSGNNTISLAFPGEN